jgi:uncharacterized protein YbjQ (UPF0145 family)
MIITTTSTIDGHPIQEYLGVAAGEVILGANMFKDIASGFRDFFGGRSGSYEEVVVRARETALADLVARCEALGANAIVGLDIDYETIDRGSGDGGGSSMMLVSASGTAVRVAP